MWKKISTCGIKSEDLSCKEINDNQEVTNIFGWGCWLSAAALINTSPFWINEFLQLHFASIFMQIVIFH